MNQKIIIIGATSAIAEAFARHNAQDGAEFFLVARDLKKLQIISSDLRARGAEKVQSFVMDANNSDDIPSMLDFAWSTLGRVDVALIAHGTLPEQLRTEVDIKYAIAEFRTNAESVIVCLTGLARHFESQRDGVIAVIGSVAGDRGRASNYLYGAAKSAVETYASGMRARLFKSGVHLLIIKPGFVATPMTANLNLPKILTASTEKVALDIKNAVIKRRYVLYTPWFWRWIMLIIRLVPDVIFKRTKF